MLHHVESARAVNIYIYRDSQAFTDIYYIVRFCDRAY